MARGVKDQTISVLEKILGIIDKVLGDLIVAAVSVDVVRMNRVFGSKVLRENRMRDVL